MAKSLPERDRHFALGELFLNLWSCCFAGAYCINKLVKYLTLGYVHYYGVVTDHL
jgi:hypothetical protein